MFDASNCKGIAFFRKVRAVVSCLELDHLKFPRSRSGKFF